jgi:hypothetical protein
VSERSVRKRRSPAIVRVVKRARRKFRENATTKLVIVGDDLIVSVALREMAVVFDGSDGDNADSEIG